MTTRASKYRNGGTLVEEPILDQRPPENHPDEVTSEIAPAALSPQQPTRTAEQNGTRQTTEKSTQQGTQQGTLQFVTFMAGDEVFAADMTPVKEIIRVPEVVRVPLAPSALEGLANLRGKVLPIISLRRMFGFPELAHDDSTRALVVDVGQPLGFVVDRVSSVVGVDARHIED